MDLHFHLSFAFRSLDHKWGKPVDLDTSLDTEEVPCVPAVIEKPVTTFSSEDYLKNVKRSRPKPYSRINEKRRRKDSFSNISISRLPSVSDLGRSVSSLDTRSNDDISLVGVMDDLIEDLEKSLEGTPAKDWGSREKIGFCGSTGTLDSVVESRKSEVNSILRELKRSAIAFAEKKYWKKIRR